MQGYRDGNVRHIPGNGKWFHVVGPSSAPVISVRSNLGKVGRDWTDVFFMLYLGTWPYSCGQWKAIKEG